MGMTMTQRSFSHCGLDEVKAGQLIMADLDLVLGNDITTGGSKGIFKTEEYGSLQQGEDRDRTGPFAPNKDIKAAEQCKFIKGIRQGQTDRELLRSWRDGH